MKNMRLIGGRIHTGLMVDVEIYCSGVQPAHALDKILEWEDKNPLKPGQWKEWEHSECPGLKFRIVKIKR